MQWEVEADRVLTEFSWTLARNDAHSPAEYLLVLFFKILPKQPARKTRKAVAQGQIIV